MQFRTIPQDNQFEISEDGTIVRRILPGWGTRVGKCIHIRKKDGRYFRVKLMGKLYQIHVLVCHAFNGPPPKGKPFALHINDKPHENHFLNLYWGDKYDNARDSRSNGSNRVHEDHPKAKLTKKQVSEIRALRGALSERKIASMFGISRSTINFIHAGRTWNEKSRPARNPVGT
jgi:hypothetical protein